ncbi:MAG: carboxypeptidase-like regulatory domain-containing protein [Dehalococcoidia bacterium]
MIKGFSPLLLGIAIIVAAGVLSLHVAPAYAQSPTIVSGRVTNGTPGAEAPMGLSVSLTVLDGDTPVEQLSTTTDENGAFSFSDVPEGLGLRYVVSVEYQGAFYQVEALLEQDTVIDLTVYESTTDGEVITVLDDTLMATRGDEKFGDLLIREVIRVRNPQQLSFVPSFDQEGLGGMTFLRFSLPFGYEDLTVRSDLLGGQIIPVDRGIGITAPVPPGVHAIVLIYAIPYEGDSLVFEPLFPFGVQDLRVLIRDDTGSVVGSNMEEIEPVTVGESTFRVFHSSDIAPGERITLGFTDLPQAPWTDRAWDAIESRWELSLVIPGLTAILLLALLVYAWRLRLKQVASVAPEALAQSIQRQPVQRRWLEAIARLDESFERGEVLEEDYSSRREELKRALLRQVVKDARYL